MSLEIYIYDDYQNDQLGAGAIIAEAIVDVTWNGSDTPDRDNGAAIKNYFVGRKFSIESVSVHRNSWTLVYTVGVRFICSKRAAENLDTVRKAFLGYMATKGYISYADVHFVGEDGQPQYMGAPGTTPDKTGNGANNPGNPKPKEKSLGAQLDEFFNKYKSSIPWAVAGIVVVMALKD